jgi:exodeoxyribonuclease I
VSFVFYDTETTGTDASFDQILQFAAIRTDADLNELDRFEIRCRLLPHIVASPGAMRVTKLPAARLFDPALPSYYEMACQIRKTLLAWSPALFIGYNSLAFDEHLLRQTFYKTLHPPYLTNTERNSRSDALRIVQASSLFAPSALRFPIGAEGEIIFKLDEIAPLNGFAHERAHDAMADVEATIFLCRTLLERAPDVWSAFMRFSQKAAVVDHISAEPIFCLSDFYFGQPYSWLVTVIGRDAQNTSEFFVYNLSIEPELLSALSDDELAARLAASPKPVRRLRANASPIIVPVEDAPAIAGAAQLGAEELARRSNFLRNDPDLCARLVAAFQALKEEPVPSPHLERQLYDGFYPKDDEPLIERFHIVPWEERLPIVDAFTDRRLRKIGHRLIYLERPDLLTPQVRADYDRAIAGRIGNADSAAPWLTLNAALAELDELLAAAEPGELEMLQAHRDHISRRIAEAALILGGVPQSAAAKPLVSA